MITVSELAEKLSKEQEIDLIEALGVDSSDLVQAFEDKIEEKQEYLIHTFGYEDEEDLDG